MLVLDRLNEFRHIPAQGRTHAMNKPTDPAISGNEASLLLHAYVDGELDVASALSVKERLDADPRLAAELANVVALQKVVRERFPREPVAPSFRSRIDASLGLRRRSGGPSWTAMVAAILVAIALSSGSTWIALRAPQIDPAIAEIVDGHMRGLLAQRPTDVASSERHTVKPWFNDRVPQAPRVVDLAADGFPLVGARIDVIGATPVPTLVYNRRLHVISLTATASASGGSTRPQVHRSVKGYNVVGWSIDRTAYWAVSDLNAAELETFARLFADAPPG
jgi:anti-sigma factor RsiW